MITKHDDIANILLDKVDTELLLKCLSPKERDTLVLWLHGGYSRQEIAEIIKIRYNDRVEVDGRVIGVRVQTIISKLRAKINPRINKRTKRIAK